MLKIRYQNEIDDYLIANDEKIKSVLLQLPSQMISCNYKTRCALNDDLKDLMGKCENEIEVMREAMKNDLSEIKNEFMKISCDQRSCILF